MREKVIRDNYQITANGVYRCCKYLVNLTFYNDENGWTGENEEIRSYSYKTILKFLRENYSSTSIRGVNYYDGELLWTSFFLKDEFLSKRIQDRRISDIMILHHYADRAANGLKRW